MKYTIVDQEKELGSRLMITMARLNLLHSRDIPLNWMQAYGEELPDGGHKLRCSAACGGFIIANRKVCRGDIKRTAGAIGKMLVELDWSMFRNQPLCPECANKIKSDHVELFQIAGVMDIDSFQEYQSRVRAILKRLGG